MESWHRSSFCNIPSGVLTISAKQRFTALARAVLFWLACAIVLIVVSALARHLSGYRSMALVELSASVLTLGLTLGFARWDQLRLSGIGIDPSQRTISHLALGTLIGLSIGAAQALISHALGHTRWILSPSSIHGTLIIAAVAFLFGALREELAFHAYPLFRLDRGLGPWPALLVVTLVFAVEHVAGGVTWFHAITGAAAGGLFFGLLALITRGIAMPIGAHAALNFSLWLFGAKDDPGLFRIVPQPGFERSVERNTTIAYILVMGLAIAIALLYRRTSTRPGAPSSPRSG
ncbi:MAG: CPBP family intramembrane metalloprotease [Acidobacteria bacterium]|nr:CPBP family intramembrane metalloprotease [Acidobacteriota bacterium]